MPYSSSADPVGGGDMKRVFKQTGSSTPFARILGTVCLKL